MRGTIVIAFAAVLLALATCQQAVDPEVPPDGGTGTDTDTDSDTDSDTDTDSDSDSDTDADTDTDTDTGTDTADFVPGWGPACPDDTPDIFNNEFNPFFGSTESVDMIVVYFSYFRCSACAAFANQLPEIWDNRPDFQERVRVYYHHYPFGDDPESDPWLVHAATRAASNQGQANFWAMHNFIWELYNQDPHVYADPDDVLGFVNDELDLDIVEFGEDMYSDETAEFLVFEKSQLQAQGYSSTPSVFVCGEKINWGNLEEEIDVFLNP
jgi:hypothetical protein